MTAIIDGLLCTATILPSPNFNKRPENASVRLIVIHNISLPPSEFDNKNVRKTDKAGLHYVKAFFLNQLNANDHPYFATIYQMQVSSHLFIERDGTVTQFVNFDDRAWHAGKSSYLGVENCNDYSIGIELEGDDFSEFTEVQYEKLAQTVRAINQVYPKTVNQLAGHSDIARGRKTDPGLEFDWVKLRKML